ncbi:unnamed protein product [Aphanomyces euteiches]
MPVLITRCHLLPFQLWQVSPLPPSPTHVSPAAVPPDHASANHENVPMGQTFAPSSLAQHLFPATIPPTEEHLPPDAERRMTLSTIYSIPYAPEIYREGPFSDPSVTANTTQPAADIKATANTAVDQTYAHFDTAQKYQALSNQPNPPLFDGVTAAEKKKIMREYQHYWHHLASLQNLGFKPLIMPVGNCISDYRRRMISLRNGGNPIGQRYGRNVAAVLS